MVAVSDAIKKGGETSAPDVSDNCEEAVKEREHLHRVFEHQPRQHDDQQVANAAAECGEVRRQLHIERRVQGDAEVALATKQQDDERADVDKTSFR